MKNTVAYFIVKAPVSALCVLQYYVTYGFHIHTLLHPLTCDGNRLYILDDYPSIDQLPNKRVCVFNLSCKEKSTDDLVGVCWMLTINKNSARVIVTKWIDIQSKTTR